MKLKLPSKVFTVGDCPVGCGGGDELVILRARPSGNLFLYCTWCGVAYRREKIDLSELLSWSDFAPEGIDFPSRRQVVEVFGSVDLFDRRFEINDFWDCVSRTYQACNDLNSALEIVENVIETWHQPPDEALELRDILERAKEKQ